MYLAKARKQMEEQDMKEMQTKADKRSDASRGGSQQVKSRGIGLGDLGIGVRRGSASSRDDFKPDDLPDGAFVSPKHTPTQMRPEEMTIERPAEYIGSFSVCGTDEDTRALQVETQLQSLQTVQQGKRVELDINLQGVKVTAIEDQTVLMYHELKRISYAACDPQHLQFSFLAREKHLNIQYCHTFRTATPEQAEELNVIMGDAFKMAYANQRDTQPTFHELIEAQIVQQQARFREIERQAQAELQRKLAEIARPTPFSQQASQWLEQRKVPAEEAEPELLVGKNKLWAKHAVGQVRHRGSVDERSMDDTLLLDSQGQQIGAAIFHAGMMERREAIGRDVLPDITNRDFRADSSEAENRGHLSSLSSSMDVRKSGSSLLPIHPENRNSILSVIYETSSISSLSRNSISSMTSGSRSNAATSQNLPWLNYSRHNSAPLPLSSDGTTNMVSEVGEILGKRNWPLTSTHAQVHVSAATNQDTCSKVLPVKMLKSGVGKHFVRSASDSLTMQRALASYVDGDSLARDQKEASPDSRSQPTAPPTVSSPVSSTSSSGSRTASSTSATTTSTAADAQTHQRPALAPPEQHCHSLEDEDASILPLSSSSPSPLSGRQANGARSSPGKKAQRPSSDNSAQQVSAGGQRAGAKRHDNWQLVDMLGTVVESKTAQVLEAEVFEPRPVPARVIKPPTRSPPPEPPPTPPPESPPPPVCLLSPEQLPTPEVEEEEEEEECVWPDLPPPGDLIIEEEEQEEYDESEGQDSDKNIVGLESPEEKSSECFSYDDEEGGVAEGGSDDRSESPSSMIINEDVPITAAPGWFSKGMMESSMSLDRREIEDPSLRQAPWYQPGIPREIALEILQQDVLGSFIIRDSATHLGCFALSVRVPESVSRTGVSHYVIAKNPKGFRLKGGSNKDFPNLTALVTYHTQHTDNMPCKLRLLHNARNLTFMAAEREDSEEDGGSASAFASISTTGSGESADDDVAVSCVDQLRL